jgi:hypothetical protein
VLYFIAYNDIPWHAGAAVHHRVPFHPLVGEDVLLVFGYSGHQHGNVQ